MSDEAKPKVCVLFDVENILFTAVNDVDLIGHDANRVLRASIVAIEKVARSLGEVHLRIGALSLPRANRLDSIANLTARMTARRDRLTFAQILSDSGYEVGLVLEKQHAADNMLCRTGPTIAEDFDVIVVATGDGEEPFATLYRKLLISGKRVHVMSYKWIPAKIKYRKGISYNCIASEVVELLEGRGKPEEFAKEQERKTAMTSEETEASLYKKLRQSVRAFARHGAKGIDPQHLLWTRLAICTMKEFFAQYKVQEARYHQLVGHLISKLPVWPDPKPEINLVKVLVSALSATDLFERTEVYVPNHASALWNPAEQPEK